MARWGDWNGEVSTGSSRRVTLWACPLCPYRQWARRCPRCPDCHVATDEAGDY